MNCTPAGSNNVDLKFQQHDYSTYLAGAKGFIYVILDPVGTGRQVSAEMILVNH